MKINIEDLLLNDNFVKAVRQNDRDIIDNLTKLHPNKKEEINAAIMLIKHMNIEYSANYSIGKEQIDWEQINERIQKHKFSLAKRKRFKYLTTAIAACITILLIILPNYLTKEDKAGKEKMIVTLEQLSADNSEEVRVIAGEKTAQINNEETITQTSEGGIKVGNEEQINAEEIVTEYITVIVPNGKRSKLIFSDQSTATLNSGTKIIYPKQFRKDIREITIDGEAYLSITEDSKRPFKVYTSRMEVKVLGTEFNVNAYSQDLTSSIILTKGSIEVKQDQKEMKLEVNQGAFLTDNSFAIETINPELYTSWKDGYLLLNSNKLEEVSLRLSRYYNTEIILNDKNKNKKFSGKLILEDSLEEVLKNLIYSSELELTKNENSFNIN